MYAKTFGYIMFIEQTRESPQLSNNDNNNHKIIQKPKKQLYKTTQSE